MLTTVGKLILVSLTSAGHINVPLNPASVENKILSHCATSVNKCQNMVHLVIEISPVQSGGLCELHTSRVSSPHYEIGWLVLATYRTRERTSSMRVLATYFTLEFVSLCVWVRACVRGWWLAWLKCWTHHVGLGAGKRQSSKWISWHSHIR